MTDKVKKKYSTRKESYFEPQKDIYHNRYEFREIRMKLEPQPPLFEKNTSIIVSAPNSFLHWSMSDHICFAFSISNFLAFKNL